MHTIERKHPSGHKTYTIYTEYEAKRKGIDFVDWRDARKGDMAVTDDGYVMECLARYETKGSDQVVLCGGRSWVNGSGHIIHDDYRAAGNYSYNKPQTWDQKEVKLKRTDRAIRILAASLIATGKYDWQAAGEAYRPKQEVPEATLKRLMRKDTAKMKLNEELIKIYQEKNFTKSSVIDDLMEARELAKDKQDLANLNRAIETSIKLLAMEPKRQTTTNEMEIDFSKEISDGIHKEQGRLTARQTKEGEDEGQYVGELPEGRDE